MDYKFWVTDFADWQEPAGFKALARSWTKKPSWTKQKMSIKMSKSIINKSRKVSNNRKTTTMNSKRSFKNSKTRKPIEFLSSWRWQMVSRSRMKNNRTD